MGDDGAEEADGLHTVNWGVTQGDGGGWGWVLPEIYNHLHCFQRVELQVVLATPGHQMVNLPPVSGLIATRDKPNEGGVIRELEEFDGLVTGGAAVCIQGEEERGRNSSCGAAGGNGCALRDVLH